MNRTPLSNVQQELLKLYSRDVPDDDLLELRKVVADYFARKAEEQMEKLWDERGLGNSDMEQWLKEHNRARQ